MFSCAFYLNVWEIPVLLKILCSQQRVSTHSTVAVWIKEKTCKLDHRLWEFIGSSDGNLDTNREGDRLVIRGSLVSWIGSTKLYGSVQIVVAAAVPAADAPAADASVNR